MPEMAVSFCAITIFTNLFNVDLAAFLLKLAVAVFKIFTDFL